MKNTANDALRAHIIQDIEQHNGAITFSRFMQHALYTPRLGYYSGGLAKIGEAGDFITAPEISSLYSRSLARQISSILASLEGGSLLEFGAGSGIMAVDILHYLKENNNLPEKYYIVELSADLAQRQQARLKAHHPDFFEHITWLQTLPKANSFSGVIIGNEVLDAMPVTRFRFKENSFFEQYVGYQDGAFTFIDKPLEKTPLACQLRALKHAYFQESTEYLSEINQALPAWINSLNHFLKRGVVLLVDYGFAAHEYYHPSRTTGTLMCHHQHHAHPNPLISVGEQDITAHVDFTAVANAAVDAGLDVLGYTSQAFFLLANGITDDIPSDTKQALIANQAIKKLTMPQEMGELFKVIALGKDWDEPLQGFSMQDLRGRL